VRENSCGRLELTQHLCFFVTRAKSNFDYRRLCYRKVDKSTGLRCDQTIRLNGFYASQDYPAVLRRIGYFDIETNKKFIFLTNNFALPALTIARLYKCRWKIEKLFQVDQAVPTNQTMFLPRRERAEDTSLDCYQHLCVGGDCQENTQSRTEFGRDPANSQHCTSRESSSQTSTYERHVAKQESRFS